MKLYSKINRIETVEDKIYIALNKGLTKKELETLLKFIKIKNKGNRIFNSYRFLNNHKKCLILNFKTIDK